MTLNDEMSLKLYRDSDNVDSLSEIAHQRLWNRLWAYYVTGGMPQVVSTYLNHRDNPFMENYQANATRKTTFSSGLFLAHPGK